MSLKKKKKERKRKTKEQDFPYEGKKEVGMMEKVLRPQKSHSIKGVTAHLYKAHTPGSKDKAVPAPT